MSVNGDLMVIRNGRSTSQVSVYNYPEHLNPFYEDDNHKRLRFWKLNKGKDGDGRRSSFSLGGLKDMWAFKSFRMKKKSSSLGINKTSESPPQMRRDIYANENGYSTYDPRMRYTTGQSNGGSDAFQRNVPYRSSLQDMRSEQSTPINGIGFNRNDRYRSTIQTATSSGTASSSPTQSLTLPPPRRYVYRGSVTPQPVRNNDFNSDTLGMISRGSSQASVASTNPFDDDDDDDVVMAGVSASSTPSKHPARKKRRAPPPPVPAHQIITEESSSAGSTPSHKPSNKHDDERVEIRNLTAEIESFVKLSNCDSPEHEVRSSTSTTTTTTTTRADVSKSPKQNGTIPKALPAQKTNGTVNTNVDIIITPDVEPLYIREDEDVEITVKKDTPVTIVEKQVKSPVKEVGHVEAIYVHVESPRSSPEKTEPSRVSTFRSETRPDSPEKTVRRPSKEKEVTSTTLEVLQVHTSTKKPVEELKIKETPEKPPIAAKPNIPRSPPSLSPTGDRQKIETPDTPAMRRREIKIEADLPSTPESNHREIGIDVQPIVKPIVKPQEVTIKITQVATTVEEPVKPWDASDIPIPALREHRPQTSPLPAARKVIITENELNLSTKREPKAEPNVTKIEVEEKISNLDANIPLTVEQLQLQIAELDENVPQVSEPTVTNSAMAEAVTAEPIAPSTSKIEGVQPAPIEKPPRVKHFAEEIPENIYRPRPSQWKESTLAPLEPVPPEKRRSVKQIIESINRSQRLLNGKKEDECTDLDTVNSQRNMSEANTNAMEQNLKSLAESQREMKRMLEELDGLENVNERKLSNKSDENFQGILDTIVSTLARETAKNKEASIFKKCTITKEVNNNASRESSPTSSNLDWNPVPKPKRTKNRSPELEVKKNNN